MSKMRHKTGFGQMSHIIMVIVYLQMVIGQLQLVTV